MCCYHRAFRHNWVIFPDRARHREDPRIWLLLKGNHLVAGESDCENVQNVIDKLDNICFFNFMIKIETMKKEKHILLKEETCIR